MAKKGQKFKKVILEERLRAVKECMEEGKTYSYVANKYGVPRGTVSTWVRIYKRDNGLDIRKKGREPITTKDNLEEKYEILKKYLEYLKGVDHEIK